MKTELSRYFTLCVCACWECTYIDKMVTEFRCVWLVIWWLWTWCMGVEVRGVCVCSLWCILKYGVWCQFWRRHDKTPLGYQRNKGNFSSVLLLLLRYLFHSQHSCRSCRLLIFYYFRTHMALFSCCVAGFVWCFSLLTYCPCECCTYFPRASDLNITSIPLWSCISVTYNHYSWDPSQDLALSCSSSGL